MRVQVFSVTKSFFSFTWKLDPEELGARLSGWLQENPNIEIKEIKHDVVNGVWYPPQLIVFVYYV
jgi:hypothetical protein